MGSANSASPSASFAPKNWTELFGVHIALLESHTRLLYDFAHTLHQEPVLALTVRRMYTRSLEAVQEARHCEQHLPITHGAMMDGAEQALPIRRVKRGGEEDESGIVRAAKRRRAELVPGSDLRVSLPAIEVDDIEAEVDARLLRKEEGRREQNGEVARHAVKRKRSCTESIPASVVHGVGPRSAISDAKREKRVKIENIGTGELRRENKGGHVQADVAVRAPLSKRRMSAGSIYRSRDGARYEDKRRRR